MAHSDRLADATEKLGAALEALDRAFAKHLEDENSVVALRDEIQSLREERDRLAAELEAERTRASKLESASDEVSDRLESVIVSLKSLSKSA